MEIVEGTWPSKGETSRRGPEDSAPQHPWALGLQAHSGRLLGTLLGSNIRAQWECPRPGGPFCSQVFRARIPAGCLGGGGDLLSPDK